MVPRFSAKWPLVVCSFPPQHEIDGRMRRLELDDLLLNMNGHLGVSASKRLRSEYRDREQENTVSQHHSTSWIAPGV
jgi:hypothetical protein